jgi:uncharacterized protein (DUF169 family)
MDMSRGCHWNTEGWSEVLQKIDLKTPAVCVRFSTKPPEDVPKLEGTLRLCEMLKAAQEGQAFYAGPENHLCGAALYSLGKDLPPVYTSGVYGTELGVYDNPRTASRLYDHIPRLEQRRGIEYVSLASLDRTTYDPDLLILMTHEEQTEIVLRAMSYSTGEMWTSKSTGVIGCAWLFAYPYLSGELNFTPVLSLGMRALHVFPPGSHLISIPFNMLSGMLESLKDMPIVLPSLQPGGDEVRREMLERLGLDPTH